MTRTTRRWILRITAAVLALLLLASVGGYTYATRPARLRTLLAQTLEASNLRLVSLGSISFAPWTGLQLSDLSVDLPANRMMLEKLGLPPLLTVSYAEIRGEPASLLRGHFKLTDIRADGVRVNIVHDPAANTSNVDLSDAPHESNVPRNIPAWPRISLHQADVSLYTLRSGEPRLERRWLFDVFGSVVPRSASNPAEPVYTLQVDQTGGPAPRIAALSHAFAGARFATVNVAERSWNLGLDWLDESTLLALLPPSVSGELATWNPGGMIALDRIAFGPRGLEELRVRVAEAHLTIPLEECEPLAPEARYLDGADFAATGALTADPGSAAAAPTYTLTIGAQGLLAESPAVFSLAAEGVRLDRIFTGDPNAGPPAESCDAALTLERLLLPTLAAHPSFVTSERLPGPVRTFFREYSPTGNARLSIRYAGRARQRADAGGRLWQNTLDGELEPLDASFQFQDFPYAVNDVRGQIRFGPDGIALDSLTGRHGIARIRADGKLNNTNSWTGFELRIRAHEVPLDDQLHAALPAHYKTVWEEAAPVGLCDVYTVITRAEGTPETGPLKPRIDVSARLEAGSVTLIPGERLTHTDGLLNIEGATVHVRDLHGYRGNAGVRLDGDVQLATNANAVADANLRLEVHNLPIDQTEQLKDQDGKPIGTLRFIGVGDVWTRVQRSANDSDALVRGVVHLRDGLLSGFQSAAFWQNVRGWFVRDESSRSFLSITAKRPGGDFRVVGSIGGGPRAPIELELSAADQHLTALLNEIVPQPWAFVRERLGFAGDGRIRVQFYPQPEPSYLRLQAADIDVNAARMRPTPVPLDLRDVTAHLTLRTDGFDLDRATATYGPGGTIQISGAGGWEASEQWTTLKLDANELTLCPDFVAAMPDPLSSLLKQLQPRGALTARLDKLQVKQREAREWQIVGGLRLQDAELNLGVSLERFTGQITGECDVDTSTGVRVDARFEVDEGRLSGRDIRRCAGQFRYAPGDPWVHVTDISGQLGGGEFTGLAEVRPDTRDYQLSLELHDCALSALFPPETLRSGDAPTGRCDGYVFLRGRGSDPLTRSGGGELRIRNTPLAGSPVLESVAKAGRARKQTFRDKIELIELRFAWEKTALQLTHVAIEGGDVRLVGEGRWDMQTNELSLTLLGAHPETLPKVALLTDLLVLAGEELVQYRVEGTADNPRVTAEPLYTLTDPLRKLLRGQ